MTKNWQLQEAKNRLSAVVNNAIAGDPQIITKHGREVVVVIAIDAYRKFTQPESKLSELFTKSPLAGKEIDFTRDNSPAREPLEL